MSLTNVPLRIVCITSGILLVALFLGLWQWFDQKSRDPDPDPDDRDFFRHQDFRRYLGVAVMVALGLLIALGSIHAFDVVTTRRVASVWAVIWMVVCGLIVVLLALALVDGLATQKYARRQRKALEQEHAELMLDVIRRTGSSGAGRPAPDKKTEGPGP